MPLPSPTSYADKSQYISACMSAQKGETKEQDQKLAICFSKWSNKNESNIIEKIDKLLGDETVTGNVAVNTAGCGIAKRQKKRKKEYEVTESSGSPRPGDRFIYKGKKLTITHVGSGLGMDKYIEVQFDNEKIKRDIHMKDFFKGNDFKYINEDNKYIYVKHTKKNKMLRVANDPKVIQKYKDQGYEIVESIYGATLTSTQIAGSGQTRTVGDYNFIMNLRRPVRFNKLTGTFAPVKEAITHKRSEKEIKKYISRVSELVNKGKTFDAAAIEAKDEMKKGKFK